jgi:phospholipid/cholesterol/gamma-HCH transport system ATP-binding protein
MSVPIIEFRNVSVSFDDYPALVDVSFTLSQGEMIFLTGVSGSGKSVLLRLAIGLLRPDEGKIFINGREIENLNESELLAIRGGSMGMVFQEESLFTGYSAYDNAAYRLQEHGWSESAVDEAVREVLKFVGLENEGDKFPEELSGGMKRRLEIARALIGWPSIMLFDEPTLSLDPIVALQILDLIIRARDINHISTLYVTKKLQEIPYLAKYRAVTDDRGEVSIIEVKDNRLLPQTKVILLEQGCIVFQGSVDEFENSKLPAVTALLEAFEVHTQQLYVANPWDKSRKPGERIL